MKKFLAILLAAMLVLSMTAVAFADGTAEDPTEPTTPSITVDGETYNDITSVNIQKIYQLVNAGTVSPAETFTVTMKENGSSVLDGDATSAPALGTITGATFAQEAATVDGVTANITINLPEYTRVGVYQYMLTETVGDTAGVVYHTGDIKLIVTVMQGNDGKVRVAAVHTEAADSQTKTGSITNTYEAGSLAVSKEVTGNMGDKDKYFDVTVTFNAPAGKTVKAPISYVVGENTLTIESTAWVEGVASVDISLKHGDTITFTNIPYGVTYTVEEADYTGDKGGYEEAQYTWSDTNKKIDSASDTVQITNTKGEEIDTGITMDSLPYVLLMGIVLLAGAAMIIKRRAHNN